MLTTLDLSVWPNDMRAIRKPGRRAVTRRAHTERSLIGSRRKTLRFVRSSWYHKLKISSTFTSFSFSLLSSKRPMVVPSPTPLSYLPLLHCMLRVSVSLCCEWRLCGFIAHFESVITCFGRGRGFRRYSLEIFGSRSRFAICDTAFWRKDDKRLDSSCVLQLLIEL
jgi:hypothetical protein